MCSKATLSEITKRLSSVYQDVYGTNLVKVILYGSYARGDNSEDSDVDIVGIVKGNRVELQEKLYQIWDQSADMELEYETILSPTVIPQDEYEKYRNDLPYYRNIDREGVIVYA